MKIPVIFVLLILALLLGACGSPAPATQEPAPATLPAQPAPANTSQSPAATQTAAQEKVEPTATTPPTPQPTPEPTPVPQPQLPALVNEPGFYIFTNANQVNDLTLYENWVFAASIGGFVSWNLEDGTYRKYTTQDGLSHISIYAVETCNMPEPRIVIGHETGVDLFDPVTGGFQRLQVPEERNTLTGAKISELYCDQPNNRLLIGYSGLGIFDFAANTYTRYTRDQGLIWSGVSGLAVVGKDIWIANGYNGINVVQGDQIATHNLASGMPDERARSIAVTSDGSIWVGASKGLLRYKNTQWSLYDRNNSDVPGEVNNLIVDSDGQLWLTTYPIGTGVVCRFDPVAGNCAFRYTYPRDGISALVVIGSGDSQTAAIGTRQGLQVLRNGATEPEPWVIQDDARLLSNFVDSFALDSVGRVWVGTGSGMHLIAPENHDLPWTDYRELRDDSNSPGGNWASDLVPGAQAGMWAVITNGNLSYFDGVDQWTVFADDSFYSVTTVGEDALSRLWVANDDEPLRVLEQGQVVQELTATDGIPEDDINVLFRVGDTLWIGGGGLSRFQDGQLEVVMTKDQLPGIIDLTLDPQGNLLIAAYGSLVRLETSGDAMYLLKGEFGSTILDGFTSITAVAADSTGTIYLSTTSGLLVSPDGGTTWQRLTTTDGLTTNVLRSVFVDPYDTVWISAGYSGGGGGFMRLIP